MTCLGMCLSEKLRTVRRFAMVLWKFLAALRVEFGGEPGGVWGLRGIQPVGWVDEDGGFGIGVISCLIVFPRGGGVGNGLEWFKVPMFWGDGY